MAVSPPICPYCNRDADIVDSSVVYRGVSHGMIWLCRPCDAYVGVHKNSKDHKPLGRLANKELREWKKKAHTAFDPFWIKKMRLHGCSKGEARGKGYKWLAEQLGVSGAECHIGMMDVVMCKRVVEVCAAFRNNGKS